MGSKWGQGIHLTPVGVHADVVEENQAARANLSLLCLRDHASVHVLLISGVQAPQSLPLVPMVLKPAKRAHIPT